MNQDSRKVEYVELCACGHPFASHTGGNPGAGTHEACIEGHPTEWKDPKDALRGRSCWQYQPLSKYRESMAFLERMRNKNTPRRSRCVTMFDEMTAREADDIFLAAVVALDNTPPTSPYKAVFQSLAEKYDFEKRTFAPREAKA